MARHPGRFSYIQYDNVGVEQQATLKSKFEEIEKLFNQYWADAALGMNPVGRAKALALTALEEAYMWSGKAVRDAQVDRSNKPVNDQPARGNE